MFRHLGAKNIEFYGYGEWNIIHAHPESFFPSIAPRNYTYLPHILSWMESVKQRFLSWNDETNIEFIHDQDYNINDVLVDKALSKLDIDNKERIELFPNHHGFLLNEPNTNNSLKVSKHIFHFTGASSKNKKYTPEKEGNNNSYNNNHNNTFISIPVHIQYFTKEEYRCHTRDYIRHNWTVYHIQAFLRLTDNIKYSKLFFSNHINGRLLLSYDNVIVNPNDDETNNNVAVTRNHHLNIFLTSIGININTSNQMELKEINYLINKINELGTISDSDMAAGRDMTFSTSGVGNTDGSGSMQPNTTTANSTNCNADVMGGSKSSKMLSSLSSQQYTGITILGEVDEVVEEVQLEIEAFVAKERLLIEQKQDADRRNNRRAPTEHKSASMNEANRNPKDGSRPAVTPVSSQHQSQKAGVVGVGVSNTTANENVKKATNAKSTYHFVVLGDENVGKTSILNTLRSFSSYVPPVESSSASTVASPSIGEQMVHFEFNFEFDSYAIDVWDISSNSIKNSPTVYVNYTRHCDAIILVYDITNNKSFLSLQIIYNNIMKEGIYLFIFSFTDYFINISIYIWYMVYGICIHIPSHRINSIQ